mgnify:CR=1 FL=1
MTQAPLTREVKIPFASTRNSCKLCAPLGASVAYRGIDGCVPLVHGSQGCSTYIRRYVISHFREPIDVASSNFTESSAVFGGAENLARALDNITKQYSPRAIGIASTCLSETMGEDVSMHLRSYRSSRPEGGPAIFNASTPSYRGTHIDGFHEAVYAAVAALAGKGEASERTPGARRVNAFPGFVSAEDLRALKATIASFGLEGTLMPDYSETLDGESWAEYQKLPEGGTPIDAIRSMDKANASVQLGFAVSERSDSAAYLEREFGVKAERLELPIGVVNTDRFMDTLARLSGNPVPREETKARGRLVDAYIDGHKYLFGKRAIVYGDEDFAVAISGFLAEIGVIPVVAATGAATGNFARRIAGACGEIAGEIAAFEDTDFATTLDRAREAKPDFAIGNSKGFYIARNLGIPLVRCGFPIHDRIGGQRILHLGYRGTANLFDLVCNALMAESQNRAKNGYTYI